MNINLNDVKRTYEFVKHKEESEIRLVDPHKKNPTISRFARNEDEFVEICKEFNGKYNVYVGINERTNGGTKKEDVLSVRTIVVDCDSIHPKDEAATKEELEKAEKIVDKIIKDLEKDGFKKPLRMMSGNGYQLWFAIPEIKVNGTNKDIVEKKLTKFQRFFMGKYNDGKNISVDNIGDLPRIVKIAGTWSVKGNNTEKRPYRIAEWCEDGKRDEDNKLRDKIMLLEIEEAKQIVVPNYKELTDKKLKNIFEKDEKLKGLYEGDYSKYPSRSEAEQALVCKLHFYEVPKSQIWELMDKCGIGKWQEKVESYREITYKKAIEFVEKHRKEERKERGEIDVYDYTYTKNDKGEIVSTKKRLNLKKLGDYILEDFPIITLREGEEMYYYNNGVWKNSPTSYVNEMAKRYTDEEITSHQIKELILQIKTMTYIDNEKIDESPYEINCKNGIYNMLTEEFEPHSEEKYIITQVPVEYDPKADCPLIKQFLTEILNEEDIPIIQKLMGYCLVKNYKHHKVFMFLGEGANGKSTLLEIIKKFLGEENISNIALQDFEWRRFSRVALRGKLANIYADLSETAMKQTGIFKMLTGEDTIAAEKKFGGFMNFRSYAKLIFSMNLAPKFTEDSLAIWRRICLIEFPNQFLDKKADKEILVKLVTQEELSGLLNWAIEGYKELEIEGFGEDNIPAIRKKYRLISDSLASFIEDRVEEDEEVGSYLTKEEFYENYVRWCKQYKTPIKAKNIVGRDIQESLPSCRSGQKSIDIFGDKQRTPIYWGIKFKKIDDSVEVHEI